MADYKEMYYSLFGSIVEAISILENGLKNGEEIFIETEEDSEEDK